MFDPSQNYIAAQAHPLDAIFAPKCIAVIGAKDDVGSVGRTLLLNLLSEPFAGSIYPVNPKRSTVLGQKSYPSVEEIGEPVDLAIIVTPAQTVLQLVKECQKAHVKGIIIISAGFKELGPEGQKLEEAILNEVKGTALRIIGPNCLGIMNPHTKLNASFAKGMALSGNIAFISQSGAMCTSVLDWSLSEQIGFSAFVSIGSMIDVDWADLIRYFGSDPNTHSILMYMETIGQARAFLSAAREIALDKPLIVIKPGRSEAAAKAAASHTGSLTGSDEVFDAALQRVGVLRVDSIAELFHMAQALGKQPRPKGPRLQIVTNAGGPAVLATDRAVMSGAKIEPLTEKTVEALNTCLPSAWSHSNPIDILGDATSDRYAKTLDIVAKDPDSDGILVILSPQDMTEPTKTAEATRHLAKSGKPILASWMGGAFVQGGIDVLKHAAIPTYQYPDDAAWSFASMWRYQENLQSLYETPTLTREPEVQRTQARIIDEVRKSKRTLLSEFESKKMLASYGIPTVETVIAETQEEAVKEAEHMGYPVVLKLFSHTITHKSDIGGVKLNLQNRDAVKEAFQAIKIAAKEHFQGVCVQRMINSKGIELIVGSSSDPQFGPVLLFGSGGVLVEIFRDHALDFPPLNNTLALRMMQKTKIYHALKGFRGQKSVPLDALVDLLVQFSLMIANEPWIKECDINPLLATPEGFIALDARIVLHDPDVDLKTLAKLACRPYPAEYIREKTLRDGMSIILRPIRPEDEPALVQFHRELSQESVRQRYFEFVELDERTRHERLVRICCSDFDRNITLVAQKLNSSELMGVARLFREPIASHGDLKMIIKDPYHGKGLGTLLLEEIQHVALREGVKTISATVLSENSGMLHLLTKAGFTLQQDALHTFAHWGQA